MLEALVQAPVATTCGAVGIVAAITWPLFHSRHWMLAMQSLIGVGFGLHFLLIGATTGGIVNGLAAAQALLAIPLGEKPGFRRVYLLTIPLIGACLVLTWQGLPSALAALAMGAVSIGRYQTAPLVFRGFMLGSIPIWFVHNLIVGSIPGLVSDALSGLSNTITFLRERRKQQRAPENTARAAEAAP